jgi:hypothetical protein
MLLKLLYILFFAASNFVVYSMLHKTGKVNRTSLLVSIVIFLVALFLHTGVLNGNHLMQFSNFLTLSIMLTFPLIAYFWFKLFALKRINRLKEKGVNEIFVDRASHIFSFFFLRITFFMAFIFQCSIIISPF